MFFGYHHILYKMKNTKDNTLAREKYGTEVNEVREYLVMKWKIKNLDYNSFLFCSDPEFIHLLGV